jgi:hypothetical protein
MLEFQSSLYELLGGEKGLRSLVDRFYDIMDSSPEAKQIRRFHAKSLKRSREKLFMLRNMGIRACECGTCPLPLVLQSVTSGCGA